MQNESAGAVNDIEILYEDDSVVVINKPAGMLVHEDGVSSGPTVGAWFLNHAPAARGIGEPGANPRGVVLERSGVVHRLDRETSGVMVLAKTEAAFEHLKSEFKDRRAKKEYRAFVYGTMKEPWGTIDRPIGRSAKDFRKRSAQRGARGRLRSAVTNWELIGQGDRHAYLKVFPQTGRTHQIRVHLKAIDRPVVGDTMYAPANLLEKEDLGFDRLALHAYALTIEFPNGTEKKCIAPLPLEFERAETCIAT